MSEPKPMPSYWALAEEVTHLNGQLDQLKAENAKLRELVRRLVDHIEHPPCEGCMFEMNCMGGEGLTQCDEFQFMRYDARELGIEV